MRDLERPDHDPETERWRVRTRRRFMLGAFSIPFALLFPVATSLIGKEILAAWAKNGTLALFSIVPLLAFVFWSLGELGARAIEFGNGLPVPLRVVVVAVARAALAMFLINRVTIWI